MVTHIHFKRAAKTGFVLRVERTTAGIVSLNTNVDRTVSLPVIRQTDRRFIRVQNLSTHK